MYMISLFWCAYLLNLFQKLVAYFCLWVVDASSCQKEVQTATLLRSTARALYLSHCLVVGQEAYDVAFVKKAMGNRQHGPGHRQESARWKSADESVVHRKNPLVINRTLTSIYVSTPNEA